MFENLRRDAERYRDYGGWWSSPGFWVMVAYRLGAWAHPVPVPVLREALLTLAWFLRQPFRMLLHVQLPFRARIGPGFLLVHPHCVLLGPDVVIGEDCTLYHEVTLGAGPTPGSPRLEDHVVVFAGARVFGGVTVGERSEIGANCVVTKSVPPRCLVVPALVRTIPQSLVRPVATQAQDGPG